MKRLLIILNFLIIGHVYAQDAKTYIQMGHEAREIADYTTAEQLYSKALKLEKNNIDALYYRGWVRNVNNKSKGLDDFHRVLELDSLHEGALHSLAESYSILRKVELADFYQAKAIAINPKLPNNLLSLGRKAIKDKEYTKAIDYLNEALEHNDETINWLLLLDRAEAYFYLEKYNEAIVDFENCFNEMAYGMYSCNNFEMCGDAYEKLGNTSKACEYWKTAVANEDPGFDNASPEVNEKAKCNF